MAVYTCYGCNRLYNTKLTFTYMSWYQGDTLIRYRFAFCNDCTKEHRELGTTIGYKRLDDGSWLGPQATLPGVTPARIDAEASSARF